MIITVVCKASKLTDLPDFEITENYFKNISETDYEFCLNVDQYYFVLGFITISSVPHFYVFSNTSPLEIEVQPAVLFDLDWQNIPNDWKIRVDKTYEIEMLPKPLAEINHWFERYIDEEEDVVKITHDLAHQMIKEYNLLNS